MSQLKAYPEYKYSGVEWVGGIPEDWNLVKLKYLSSITTGSKDTQDKVKNGAYPFFVRSDNIERINEYTHNEEVVMTAGDGVGVGKVFHYYKGKFTAHQRVYLFKNFKNSVGKFIYFYMKSNLIFEVMQGTAKSTVDSLRRSMLTEFPVSLPSVKIQNSIVEFISLQTSLIDNLISDKERLIELLEEKRQAVITESVTKGLDPNVEMKDSGIEWIGEIPEFWNVIKLKRLIKVMNGKEIENELDFEVSDSIDVYGSGGVFKKTDKYLYKGESVLFGRKGTIGKPIYVDKPFWTVDTMYYTKFYKGASPKWFYYLFSVFPWAIHTTNTALPSLVGTDIENDDSAIPSYEEQVKIVNYLDEKTSQIFNLIDETKNQIIKLKEYRESLIYEAVTGKIDVRDYATKTEEVY